METMDRIKKDAKTMERAAAKLGVAQRAINDVYQLIEEAAGGLSMHRGDMDGMGKGGLSSKDQKTADLLLKLYPQVGNLSTRAGNTQYETKQIAKRLKALCGETNNE